MIIGLTGGSGTGKSTACEFFRQRGFVIVDLDSVARTVCEKGTPCLAEIAVAFGSGVIAADGTLARRTLGNIVFSDGEKLQMLNSITHKYIIDETQEIIARHRGENLVLDAPLLFEAGLDALCTLTVCVLSAREQRLSRIMQRDSITRDGALARISSQPDDGFYTSRCDVTLRNDADVDTFMRLLEKQFGGSYGK